MQLNSVKSLTSRTPSSESARRASELSSFWSRAKRRASASAMALVFPFTLASFRLSAKCGGWLTALDALGGGSSSVS
eukprot:5529092-Amphidinium_carterae.1